MSDDKNDVIIIGAGIIGLATAYQILKKNPGIKLTILEKEQEIAQHQTGHNSGVIHSGIYYKPGSLKAENCIRGYQLLLEFCDRNDIPFELCGKIIVATSPKELISLEALYSRGVANGLKDMRFLSAEEIKEIEPYVSGLKGLFVPQTGIINYKTVCFKLSDLIKQMGGVIILGQNVCGAIETETDVMIQTRSNEYYTKYVVNCAGLYSDFITRLFIKELTIRIIPFRGEYYKIKEEKSYLIKNLVYPVPDPAFPFLGVHFTRMINGEIEAGPNAVLSLKKEGYNKTDVHLGELLSFVRFAGFRTIIRKYWRTGMKEMYRSFSKTAFTVALQKLLPEINKNDLIPAGSGVRAQACDIDGNLLDDFYFEHTNRSLHVCNAPSPAATSSLSIGETIADLLLNKAIFNELY